MIRIFIILITILAFTNTAFSQKESGNILTDGWKFSGLGHMTTQMDAKDFNSDTDPISYTFMKVRLGVEKTLGEDILFKVDIRDSRVWGSEGSPVEDLHNLDLQEGYLEFKNVFNSPLAIQAGRFIMNYDNGRFIGNSFWRMNERAFDGLRLKYHTEKFKAEYFHTNHTSGPGYILKIIPGKTYSEASGNLDPSYGVYGLWLNTTAVKDNSISLFSFFENDRTQSLEDKDNLSRITSGIHYNATFGNISPHFEFAYQMGTKTIALGETFVAKDIAAYLLSATADIKLKPLTITAGIEMYSGQDPEESDKITLIDVYMGSKHKFLGLMDYFLAVGPGTANHGVNDIFATFKYGTKKSKWIPSITFHHFMANSSMDDDPTDFGQEIDLQLVYKITKGAKLVGGAATFLQGDLMKKIWVNEDMPYWAFLMTVVNL